MVWSSGRVVVFGGVSEGVYMGDLHTGSHSSGSLLPGSRYGFACVGTRDARLFVLGGFASTKQETGSWVKEMGGYGSLPAAAKTGDVANDDHWDFSVHSQSWRRLTDSVWHAFYPLDDFHWYLFEENSLELSRSSLVHQSST